MHYTTRVQIIEEKRAAQQPTFESMDIATNALKLSGKFPSTADAMGEFLSRLALSAPRLRRANAESKEAA